MSEASGFRFSLEKIAVSGWTYVVLLVVIFLLTHMRQNAINNYDCEMCSDKAGYYVYLPATFNYGFLASDFEPGSDARYGYGFHLDTLNNKVVTKFTCGVAIMQTPFYLLARATASEKSNGPFSRHYLLFINIGLAVYITLGLYLLMRWYASQSNNRSAFLTVLLLFFGTHLYYYVLDESLMSHAYSFVLLCAALFFSSRFWKNQRLTDFIVIAAALSLAILIRPTSILFVPVVLCIGADSRKEITARLKKIFVVKNIVLAVFIFFALFLPQMMYWKFAYGHYLAWSYEGEGFTNWNSPYFFEVLFSPLGGLFPYTPILLLTVIAAIFYWRKKRDAKIVLLVFIAVAYLCASWSNPFFGECNFGKRPFVEYLPVLMLPALWFIQWLERRRGAIKVFSVSILVFFVLYNLWIFGGFDTCFGGQAWEWSRFGELLSKGTLLP